MSHQMKRSALVLCGLVLFACPRQIVAGPIQMDSGAFVATAGPGGTGSGRGIGFQANSNFSIDSIGIHGTLNVQSYDVLVYGSTDGHGRGSLLASSSAVVGGTGPIWNDIGLSFTFASGNYYTIEWRTSDLSANFGIIDYYADSGLPTTVGPVTLIDGYSIDSSNVASFDNSLDAGLRVDTVTTTPEPASLISFAVGALGMAG